MATKIFQKDVDLLPVTIQKFVDFATFVFNVKDTEDDEKTALEGIAKYEDFLRKIGCPTSFKDLSIDDSKFEDYADITLKVIHDENGNLPARPALTKKDIIELLNLAK